MRPAVIARKVSQCSKTGRGAKTFSAFCSVIRTAPKQGQDPVEGSVASSAVLNPGLPRPDDVMPSANQAKTL